MAETTDVVVFLRGQIADFKSKMQEASGEAEKLGQKGASVTQKFGVLGKAAFAGQGAAAVAAGGFSLKMADDFEQSHARLKVALQNTGSSFAALHAPIQQVEQRMEKLGFSNAQVEDSLASMTSASHSGETALKMEGLAADIARGRHMSLGDATQLLNKVLTGHVALLGRLGIQTKDATGKTISQQEAVQRLSAMYGGQAAAAANTFGGKIQTLKTQAVDLAAKFGTKLIPIIEHLATITAEIVQWFERHRAAAIALAAVVGGVLVTAMGAAIASSATFAAIIAVATSPITAIVAAVTLLAAGIYELWTHWSQVWNWIKSNPAYAAIIATLFPIVGMIVGIVAVAKFLQANWKQVWDDIQAFTQKVWSVIGPVVNAGISFVRDVINLVLDIIHGKWGQVWGDIVNILRDAWNWITGIVQSEVRYVEFIFGVALSGIKTIWHDVWSGLSDVFKSVWDGVKDTVRAGINGIISIINDAIDALNAVQIHVNFDTHIPGVPAVHFDWGGFQIPHIPELAGGGIVTRPTLALIGERGPEAVVPLGRGGGGNNYTITVNVPPVANPRAVGAEIVNAIRQYEIASGKAWRTSP